MWGIGLIQKDFSIDLEEKIPSKPSFRFLSDSPTFSSSNTLKLFPEIPEPEPTYVASLSRTRKNSTAKREVEKPRKRIKLEQDVDVSTPPLKMEHDVDVSSTPVKIETVLVPNQAEGRPFRVEQVLPKKKAESQEGKKFSFCFFRGGFQNTVSFLPKTFSKCKHTPTFGFSL